MCANLDSSSGMTGLMISGPQRTGRARKAYKDRMTFEHLFELTYKNPETGETLVNWFTVSAGMALLTGIYFYAKKKKIV